ncbi:polyribonucleotide nucleotidyltransferase [candidate division WOR-1 bacterium RIFOXYA12_FULL_52_29]|uniref:Polyribonucleotide nucleotidyltransferase n=1 Tax=candidate division WOR-1 bacterium RIFOXYC12_FULL_54_18 TaxID=1802584 RepID=A0A1F4T5I7_UNCSA|nr:MAG: polyribonucleotide nucleotidyltransferase [candidate division WOR-1 bacterium RIFOXYA2_FULL_51_19]OGC17551.1 MAG: polyribonucleotide nucleotidyltransferase [candidate division WOR-1 bacterium RIFOXYA12_FULL_52_29]OGC26408.1 MAG: polyribonucleotide nucleotidyltransferase [candidate division WOR-1 bacterium RIFOXYB2_FULL_45_9]OGC27968.1 MAG: polyribonucleotide nucleotidyltransferase [candidate division WOR-1 bacterium RIFOXYC12_FULL_54_18]OGC29745.1 MAG: polyribonucleotide nucleotidyltran
MINTVEKTLSDGKVLSIETGRVAKEAGGSVIVRIGDTMILATATMSLTPREGIDFFPLMVEFEEKLYAAGKIPGGFFKREGRLSEKAILNCRKVDRPIRPMFPEGFRNDVQVVVTPLSVDQENPHDVLGIIGASAALSISDIPFDGPIGAVRVSIVDGKFVANPTQSQTKESTLDLVIAGTKTEISMIEAGANQISEDQMLEAIKFGHTFIKESIAMQEELVKKAGKEKAKVEVYKISDKVRSFVTKEVTGRIEKAMRITDREKQMDELDAIKSDVKAKALENKELEDELKKHPGDIKAVIEEIEYETMRRLVLKENKRVDGRGPNDIREINCEIGTLPRTHGSAIFSRGQTQVLTILTLGSLGEEQRLEGLDLEETGKRYMHHYNFPAYSVGEVRPMRGPGRREIGHGALAEKALLPVVPKPDDFPYTLRLVSEVLGSNGSTSMASTCGSTLALMHAGVKIDAPVAGISVGLISEGDKFVTITDIQGLEDHLGDMDFKVTGTRKGITAIQVDIKIKGLSFDLIKRALQQAKEGRYFILDKMEAILPKPSTELSPFAPRVISFKIDPEKIGMVIGPGGKNIRRITDETGVQMDIEDDGTIRITTNDAEMAKKAKAEVDAITFEPKAGDVFHSKVVRIMDFGAFCEIPGGKDGLVHISQLAPQRVARVEDVLKLDDEVIVKVIEIDDKGRINLTMKGVTEDDKKRAM